jgi:hypothetical protein
MIVWACEVWIVDCELYNDSVLIIFWRNEPSDLS